MKILVLSDIHGNYDALEAVVEKTDYDDLICLGDLVDFGPDSRECVAWAEENAPNIIKGNHDHALSFGVSCGCPNKQIESLAEETRDYSFRALDDGQVGFLKKLPEKREMKTFGKRIYAVHAGPSDPLYQVIRTNTSDKKMREEFSKVDADYVLFGHSHKPFLNTTLIQGKVLLNPGSVGQPRDGDPRASCAVIDLARGGVKIVRVEYDVDIACRKIAEAGLSKRLCEILRTGSI